MDKNFSDFTQEFWQKALRKLVLVDGEHDEALYKRAVAVYTAEGGVYEECFNLGALPPKLVTYAGDTLPENINTVDESGNFHIPMNGDDDEVKARIWAAYTTPFQKIDQEERTTEGVRIHVSKQEYIDQDRGDRPHGQNHANNRSRGMLNILDLPYEMTEEEKTHLPEDIRNTRCFQITESRQNTWGQILDWKEFKKESSEAWQVFLNNRFSDEVMEKFSGTGTLIKIDASGKEKEPETELPLWKYWLRGLRVMNGLSTVDMTRIFDMSGNNNYQNIEMRHNGLVIEKALISLEKNLFGLPEVIDSDGNTHVDFNYAKRFMDMFGHEYYMPEHLKPQLFAAIKAISTAYLRDDIKPADMPPLGELMEILSNGKLAPFLGSSVKAFGVKSGIYVSHSSLSETSALYQLIRRGFYEIFWDDALL